MTGFRAVLLDFGDTLMHRAGGPGLVVEAAARRGTVIDLAEAARVWDNIQDRARTPGELAKGRDLSEDAHRRCWLALYAAADAIAPGISEELYDAERHRWDPYEDSLDVMRRLRAAGVGIGVLSDTGFDIRPLFAAHGLADLVDVWVLSCERGVAKPASVLFEAGCAELGTSPADTLMVGDNPLTDGGGAAAGLTTLILPPWPGSGGRGLDAVVRLAAG